ncbi:hypothetical protein B0T26DRAFT_670783 [Lasiosphaeria miniovina]|uniref:Uncharacterized protein n=1 Tax=Lasiosphaeria miniovina TaxID=1954250 RepID=A0AA40BHS5_9PEZI|nr:uncharacterized protein B0T26DRAFT_670783 [Lasiosphaeria miniovina]KAK0734492.1 hypothetical protein B0T26DRAFT_670783 [Lasiosphaeria miniovina]
MTFLAPAAGHPDMKLRQQSWETTNWMKGQGMSAEDLKWLNAFVAIDLYDSPNETGSASLLSTEEFTDSDEDKFGFTSRLYSPPSSGGPQLDTLENPKDWNVVGEDKAAVTAENVALGHMKCSSHVENSIFEGGYPVDKSWHPELPITDLRWTNITYYPDITALDPQPPKQPPPQPRQPQQPPPGQAGQPPQWQAQQLPLRQRRPLQSGQQLRRPMLQAP